MTTAEEVKQVMEKYADIVNRLVEACKMVKKELITDTSALEKLAEESRHRLQEKALDRILEIYRDKDKKSAFDEGVLLEVRELIHAFYEGEYHNQVSPTKIQSLYGIAFVLGVELL